MTDEQKDGFSSPERIVGLGPPDDVLRKLGIDGPADVHGHTFDLGVTDPACPECGECLRFEMELTPGAPARFSLSCREGHDLSGARERLVALGFSEG